MAGPISSLLDSRTVFFIGRVLLTMPFWLSGFAKLVDFSGATVEMRYFGLEPAAAFAAATILVQLLGSALVIWGRHAWLGAGALAVFTLLTIPIAHAFWTMTGNEAIIERFFVFEHIGIVGGLILVAVLCHRTHRS